jgi:BatD DUF11 like domain
MMLRKILILSFLLLPIIAAAQDDIKIQISLDRDTINIGEQASLTVTVSGSQRNLPAPELPNLSMFNVYSQGTSTNISIVNGSMETSYSYRYLLQPKRQGSFPIRPVSLVFNQKRYTSNELVLTVNEAGVSTPTTLKQEATSQEGGGGDLFLTAEVNKKTAYVNEQITLTIKFFYGVQLYSQPEYNAPQTTDFWTDVLDAQKSYYQIVDGRRYQVIEISSALFPTRSGDLTIGPAMVSAMIVVKKAPRRNDPFSMFDDFFSQGESRSVRSRPIKINVLPLPDNGKPSGFTGTVGDYTITATPDKTVVDMNQPVSVTYKISGTGNIKTIAEPNIEDIQEFRTYRASSDEKISKVGGLVGGTKAFEEVYIPKRAGTLTIPSVKLDFFNPVTKKYHSIASGAIELNVNPAATGDYADVPLRAVAGRVVESSAKDIRYIKTDPAVLSHRRTVILFTPLYMILNAIPVLLLAAVWIGSLRRAKLNSDVKYARSRAAKKVARKHLSAARKMVGAGKTAPFYAELRRAVFTYVANKLNVSPHGLTGDRLLEILSESGVSEELTAKSRELLKQADFAQYSSAEVSPGQIAESLQAAEDLLIRLEEVRLG